MGVKHRLKTIVREVYARTMWHTGLHRLVDRWSAPRLLILYGHCVDDPAFNSTLDADMKIRPERLESILRSLGRRYDLVSVGGGVERLDAGASRSMVALSMDDGYRDNLHQLVPLLERVGGSATVFLEAGAVVERELPWLHALRWLDARCGTADLARRLGERIPGAGAALAGIGEGDSNRLKRILKYDLDPGDRDSALSELIRAEGGEPRVINDGLYLSAEEARALHAAACVEIGGHTVHHPVLSRLDGPGQRAEVGGGADALRELLGGDATGAVFAYPYGRRWDFDAQSAAAAREAGYACAVTTHAGVNVAGTDRFRLHRWPIDEGSRVHLLATEASGCFELLRRFGIDLVE